MRILQFSSTGGASGDMILGALIGLGSDIDILNQKLAEMLPEEEFQIESREIDSCGIHGIRAKVNINEHHHLHNHHHAHEHKHHHGRNFRDIREIIEQSDLSEQVKERSLEVFRQIAEAEAKIHNSTPDDVHFHEVGAVDSIVDIVGCCLALEMLEIDRVAVSPLPLGQGTLTCQHGTYPVPAPATLAILKDFPVIQTDEPFEMVTPTGAALLCSWKNIEAVSGVVKGSAYSFGHRELNNRPNLLRANLIETDEASKTDDECVVLECNVDDQSPELSGAVFEKLLQVGAIDVFTTPVQMKKSRPGILLTVLCRDEDKDKFQELIFRHTTSFGIREYKVKRRILDRRFEKVSTKYGEVRIKIGSFKGKDVTFAPEFEDCAKLAEQSGGSLKDIYLEALRNLNK
jgi:uncharacterized protein (TIGR00299 family) protein